MASARMILKISQIARMRIMGIKDIVIANALGMSNSGFQRIIRTTSYKDYEVAVLAGHIGKLDEKLAENRNLLRKFARNSVPIALQGLVELARQRRDLKTALEAQRDILRIDPDKNFSPDAKIVPIGAAALPAVLFDSISHDADGVSISIQQAMSKAAKPQQEDA